MEDSEDEFGDEGRLEKPIPVIKKKLKGIWSLEESGEKRKVEIMGPSGMKNNRKWEWSKSTGWI